jgi:hypothetical protein
MPQAGSVTSSVADFTGACAVCGITTWMVQAVRERQPSVALPLPAFCRCSACGRVVCDYCCCTWRRVNP